MKPPKPVEHYHDEDICDNPAIICRTCFQYVSVQNPGIPVNGDDTCLMCLEEAAKLLRNHVAAKASADKKVRGEHAE